MATAEPIPNAMPPWPGSSIVPPLESGDRLTRDEFERRYLNMPRSCRAELIEGVVYMSSPVRADVHGEPVADFMTWLGNYRAKTPGVHVAADATLRLDLDNEPQPDVLAYIHPSPGGRLNRTSDGYLEGSPEFVAEISASSATIDLRDKFRAYRRCQVQEYVVWRTLERKIDWFVLEAGDYRTLTPDGEGILRSSVFPGLWLHAPALLQGDLAAVLRTLDVGLISPEHAAFVERLKNPKTP